MEAGSWRCEVRDGIEYHWIATTEHKTGKGKVEHLIPALTLNVLEVMQRYAKPLQDMLAGEIAEMEANTDPKGGRDRLLRSNKARRDAGKLFLCLSGSGTRRTAGYHADALSNAGSGLAFRRIAKAARTDWNLLPHQCRRTYARCIVESRMGRASL